jgi:hypothetical protein
MTTRNIAYSAHASNIASATLTAATLFLVCTLIAVLA